jgi:hypothetical protein
MVQFQKCSNIFWSLLLILITKCISNYVILQFLNTIIIIIIIIIIIKIPTHIMS